MRYIPRNLGNVVRQAAQHFPALVVTGPRRAGKTTLLRQLFPKAQYVLLEDPDIQGRIRSDPRTFLEELRPPVVFDEIQNAPELLSYVRTLVDAAPRRMGQWLFTGSQEAPLMQGITESMARPGRHPAASSFQCSGKSEGECASRRLSRSIGTSEVPSTVVRFLSPNLLGARRPSNYEHT